MCYSSRLWAEYQAVKKNYGGNISWDEFLHMARMREKENDDLFRTSIKIPDELIAGLLAEGGSAAKELALIQKRWKVKEQRQLEQAVKDAESKLLWAEEKLKSKATKTNQKAFETKKRKVDKAKAVLENASKPPADTYRIYPYYFAPIITEDDGKRMIVPARFRILPARAPKCPMPITYLTAVAIRCNPPATGSRYLESNTRSSRS